MPEEIRPLLPVEEDETEAHSEAGGEDVDGRGEHVSPPALCGALAGAVAVVLVLEALVFQAWLLGFRHEGILKGSAAAWMMSLGWPVGGLQRIGAEGMRALMPVGALFLPIGAVFGAG